MTHAGPFNLEKTFVHLSADNAAAPIEVTDSFWEDVAAGKLPQLESGRLLSTFSFSEDWNNWEMHPMGEEFVCLLSGAVDFILDEGGRHTVISLRGSGSFLLVPRGVWHTAKALAPSTMMFITPGEGTKHRPLHEERHHGKTMVE